MIGGSRQVAANQCENTRMISLLFDSRSFAKFAASFLFWLIAEC
jgi:hypothetical protein